MSYKPAVPALLLAISLTTLLSACKEEPATAAAPPPKVGVITLQPQAFALTSELPGRTSAYRVAEVRPQVNGIILKRLFTEGREVKAGQQLYQIDPALYAATLKSTQATLQSSQSLAERYKLLVDEQAVSRQEFDEARAKQMEAEAALQTATINLRYTKVLAPIAGRIGRSAVSEGALVSNGQSTAMAVIQQLDPIYVDVTQSSLEILKLRNDLASGRLQKAGNNAATVKLLLEDGSLLARIGMPYDKGQVVRIDHHGVTPVIGIEHFGRCPQRRYFALANAEGIRVTDGWGGPQVARMAWPHGLEGLPRGYPFEPFDLPPTPSALSTRGRSACTTASSSACRNR